MDRETRAAIEELRRAHRASRRACIALSIVAVLASATPALSATTIPYVFQAGTPARATEINANFQALATSIDAVDDATDGRLDAIEQRDDFVPDGTIAFFASACPSGWSDYAAARGRYVVAVSGGTVGGTVGGAMSDREDASHAHTIAHNHQWARWDSSDNHWDTYDASGARVRVRSGVRDFDNGDSRHYAILHHQDEATVDHYTSAPSTASSGSVTRGAIAPYIQLRACRKD